MSGTQLRDARRARGWTQLDLAKHLGVSQTYVSLFESGQRKVPRRVAAKLVSNLALSPTNVPVTEQTTAWSAATVAQALASLGYPGLAHLKRRRAVNPAELVFRTLLSPDVEARLVEALPWVLVQFVDLDWAWLVAQVKLNDLQNRLGFVVTLARELAERQSDEGAAQVLSVWEQRLDRSRLQREDTFANQTLTESERRWLQTHRSAEAVKWNLLSNTSVEALTSV